MTAPKLAAGYVRCSTETQEDSTRQQREDLQKYADKNSIRMIQWFEDFGQSGTQFEKRPAFSQMKSIIEKGLAGFQLILVYDESRWGRGPNPRESGYWKLHFSRFGVEVKIIHSNSSNGNDVGSIVIEAVESAESSEYSKKLSRSTSRGMIDNARSGFSNGGTPPYGYCRIAVSKVNHEKTRLLQAGEHINPETEKARWDIGDTLEIEVVKRIFDMKVKGLGDVSIADTLNRENIPTPRRGRWRNKDQKWSGTTIKTILENPTYYGARVFNRHPQSHLCGPAKELWINKKSDWIVVENAHPGIVTKETFDFANRTRKEYCRRNRHFYESPYLLSGLIRCSHCGFTFQGRKYGRARIEYYSDGGYINKGKSVCRDYKINRSEVESFVIQSIRKRILKSDLLSHLEERLTKRLKETGSDRLVQLEQMEKSLVAAKMKISRLFTAIENGVDYDMTIDRLKEAQNEQRTLEQKIGEITSANLSKVDIQIAREQIVYLMGNFETILNQSPVHVQKELLRRFIQSIVVDRETDTINVYLKTIPTLNANLAGNTSLQNPTDKDDRNTITTVQKKLTGQTRKRKKRGKQEESLKPRTISIMLDTTEGVLE